MDHNHLSTLPTNLLAPVQDTLRTLSLSSNAFTRVPVTIRALPRLTTLYVICALLVVACVWLPTQAW